MIGILFKKVLGGLALALVVTSANAGLVDIQFTVSGAATGSGEAVVDSSLIAPDSYDCCQAPSALFDSLNLELNFGQGITTFNVGDLSGFLFSIDSTGAFQDLNFWGTNIDGVTLSALAQYSDAASGNLGANGVVVYSDASIVTVEAAIPEPATDALLGLGLLGLALVCRRKR